MNNAIFNRKFTKRNENHNIIKYSSVSNQSNNSLQNLLIVIDKYKYLISKSNSTNSMLINSSTSSVINSINHVLSDFGEESIRRNTNRHSDNNTIKLETDNRITEMSTKNETWMKIVKEFQEIIVNHANINRELLTLILTTISQIHERQSLRVSDGTVLEDICSRLIDNLDNCDARIRALYLRCVASFILGNLGIIAKELFTSFSGAFFKESEKYLKAAREREFNATEKYPMSAREAEFECVECLKYCISGLTNLSYVSSNEIGEDFLAKRFQICGRFLQIFVDCLEISPCFVELSAISRFRMQHQCLHGLNYVSQRPHGLSVDNIERLLDVVRRYCGCGLGRMGGRSVTETGLTETDETSMFPGGVSTDDFGFQRGLSTDDFCFHSNNNNTANRRPMKKWETKTRKLALELLLRIVEKSWKKVSPRIWMGFMPFGGDCCGGVGGFDLVELLETETDCHTRLLAVQAIEMCVSSCKEFLVTAQQPAGPTRTFVSHSQNLAAGLMRLHGRLLHWMVADPAPVVRLRLIRCVCVLVRNAPYHRLRPGLVGDVVWQLRALFLESSRDDTAVRCAIFDCFSALVGLESVSQETRRWLIDPPRVYSGDSHVHSHLVQSTGQNSQHRCGPDQTSESPSMSSTTVVLSVESHSRRPSWLVQLCVRVAHPALVEQLWAGALSPESWERAIDPLVDKVVAEGSQQPDSELRCRALRTLSAMLPQHCSIIGPSIDTVKRTLLACLDESIPYQVSAQTAALRSDVLRVFSGLLGTLDNKKVKRYLGIMQDCQTVGNENNQTGDNCVGMESELSSGISYFSSSSSAINGVSNISSNIDLVCDWWNSFLPSVVQCLQDDNESVRRSAAQCLCFICEPVLEHMMERTAITSHWHMLLTMFRDPSSSVSCQAIWSLGYWVALRPLNSDADFIRALIGTSSRLCNAALADSSLYLECANAAWTLSNAIEVLVAHKECLLSCCQQQEKLETPTGCAAIVMEYLTDVDCVAGLMQLFCDLCGVKKAGQVSASARIHENAIRGLGYLCRFIDENMIFHLSTGGLLNLASETFSKAVQLSDKAGRVKVKWNACLSVSHVYNNRFLISKNDVFNLHKLNAALVSTVTGDRYFKVRNNSLVSINTLIDCGGRSSFGEHLFDMIIGPLAETCLSVIHKTTIPFSEVHRHCLCLYLLNFTLLKLVNLISQSDLDLLATRSDLLSLLLTVFSEQLPSIWRHLSNLNRSFNKQALLTQTLMLKLSVSATCEEVDLLLSNLRTNLDVNWVSTDSSKLAIDLLEQLYRSVSGARICDDEIIRQDENALNFCDSMSDDEGLMTKRPGTALIFSQIYD